MGARHGRFLARRRLGVVVGFLLALGGRHGLCVLGLLGCLERRVLGGAGDLLGVGGGDRVAFAGGLDGGGLGRLGAGLRRLLGGLQGGVLGRPGDLLGVLAGHCVLRGLLVGHQTSISKGVGFWATCGCSGPA